jgi:N6-adenosine-specific RNA methylase IME4
LSEPWDVIVMDPPWPERGAGKVKRGADRHYGVVSMGRMAQAIYESGHLRESSKAPDMLLWMWATETYVEDALALIRGIGFRKCAGWVWVKCNDDGTVPVRRMGLGQWSRVEHEHLLLARRGDVKVPPAAGRHRSVIFAPRGRHSEKPAAAWQVIENTSTHALLHVADREKRALRRLEMFARTTRPGWTAWGDEA